MTTTKALVERDWIRLYDSVEALDKPLSEMSSRERRKIMGLSEKAKAYRKSDKYKAYQKAYYLKKKESKNTNSHNEQNGNNKKTS